MKDPCCYANETGHQCNCLPTKDREEDADSRREDHLDGIEEDAKVERDFLDAAMDSC